MPRSTSLLCVLLLLLASVCSTADEAALPSGVGAVDLKADTFKAVISALPQSYWVLVEFYAHWCPACKQFAPVYQQIGTFFNTEPRVKPEVFVGRVDCASEEKLCQAFHVGRYPHVTLGQPAQFKEEAYKELASVDGQNDPKAIMSFINKHAGTSFDLGNRTAALESEASDLEVGRALSGKYPMATSMDLLDVEAATILAFKYALDAPENLKGLDARQAFKDFVDLLAAAHPSKQCLKGSKALQSSFQKLWPPERMEGPSEEMKNVRICGRKRNFEGWRSCKGSTEYSRGFTCGLWLLFHSLAVNTKSENGGAFWMAAVRGFVKHFFQCADCAKHFVAMASEKDAMAVRTSKEAVLWAWRAHNRVNLRVAEDEKKTKDGDPEYPKVQWPPAELCATCRLPFPAADIADINWNDQEVYTFLAKYYATPKRQGSTLHRKELGDDTTHAARLLKSRREEASSFIKSAVGVIFVAALVVTAVKAGSMSQRRPHNGQKQSL